MLQKTGIKLLLNVHFSLQTAWLMQSNSARSSRGLFSPSSPAWAAAARCWNASVLLLCWLGSQWGLRASTPSVLQVFWQASWPIWAQVQAHLHGLGWMGVQLWSTEWLPNTLGSNPTKTQAFTRVSKGPRQVTPKLSRSPYRHSSSCPWGTHSQGDSPAAITHCPHSYPALQTARDKFNILTTKHQPQAVYFSLPLKELTNQENFLSFLAVGFFSLFCSKCNRRQHSSLAYCNSPIFEVLQQVIWALHQQQMRGWNSVLSPRAFGRDMDQRIITFYKEQPSEGHFNVV